MGSTIDNSDEGETSRPLEGHHGGGGSSSNTEGFYQDEHDEGEEDIRHIDVDQNPPMINIPSLTCAFLAAMTTGESLYEHSWNVNGPNVSLLSS